MPLRLAMASHRSQSVLTTMRSIPRVSASTLSFRSSRVVSANGRTFLSFTRCDPPRTGTTATSLSAMRMFGQQFVQAATEDLDVYRACHHRDTAFEQCLSKLRIIRECAGAHAMFFGAGRNLGNELEHLAGTHRARTSQRLGQVVGP